MKAYSNSKNIEKAIVLLDKMEKDPRITPVTVTYNTFLHCAFKTKNFKLAKNVFDNMKYKDIFTYSINNQYLL